MVGQHRRRTLRGQVEEGTIKHLIVDDGRLNHGYKVVNFVIAGNPTQTSHDCFATLGLSRDFSLIWDWSDNRQIAWASTQTDTLSGMEGPFSVIDPDHVVIQDLYLKGQVGSASGTDSFNYLIELETVDLNDDETILTLIKESSQNV